ncbi:hypothetical protein HJFPF1_10437 [Paramyrothecium foliicola]|nr:hypothetical protein HJFPF1_10437 [Paramyrothecium foliicola]
MEPTSSQGDGEMSTLHHICRLPRTNWIHSWGKHRDAFGDQEACGWRYVPKLALKAYLSLNLLLCFPHLWDEKSGRNEQLDYRNTKCYQHMLRECTIAQLATNVAAVPHRQFFGIADGQYQPCPSPEDGGSHAYLLIPVSNNWTYPYGMMAIGDFLELESKSAHQPSSADVLHVRWCLCSLGLPTEIATKVMDFADYTPKRRLERAHDPLHLSNIVELRKYLDFCWNILVRCEVMSRWLGDHIPWERLVSEILIELVGVGDGSPGISEGTFYGLDEDENSDGFNLYESTIYRFK